MEKAYDGRAVRIRTDGQEGHEDVKETLRADRGCD
jgi:hypothetical protein